MMPDNLGDGSKPECHVGFSIFGISLDFEGMSKALDLQPSDTRHAGDRGALGTYPTDVWSIESPLKKREPIDLHLNWLKEKLEPHFDFLRSFEGQAQVRVYIGFTFDCEQNGFSISPENLKFLTELNTPMEVTILCGP